MNKKSISAFIAACSGMILFGIVIISLGSILPYIIDKFQLSESKAGILASTLPFGMLLGSLLFGPVIDRYGYKHILIVSSLLVALGIEGIVWSGSFLLVQAAFFILGFGGAVINGTTNALVSDISSESQAEKSANISLLGVFYGLGALGVPTILSILGTQYSIRQIFTIAGLFILFPVLYFIMITFPNSQKPVNMTVRAWLNLLRNPVLLGLGFILFLQSGLESIVSNWTTLFLQRSHDLSSEGALMMLTLFIVSFTISRLVLGWTLRTISNKIIIFISMTLGILGFALLGFFSIPYIIILAYILIGIGLAFGFPIVLGYTGMLFKEQSGTAFSIVLVVALTGNMIVNYIMGWLTEIYGIKLYPGYLVLLAVAMGITIILVFNKIYKLKN